MTPGFQVKVGQWVCSTFGFANLNNTKERATRVVEEALKLAQSVGVDREMMHELVDYVFGREKGDPQQEIAGVAITLSAVAQSLGVILERAAARELERIQKPEVQDMCRAKQEFKRGSGVAYDRRE